MSQHLLIYDGSKRSGERLLRSAWAVGARVYRGLGRIDAAYGATSWDDALHWLVKRGQQGAIAEVQFWGHGKWGMAFIDSDMLTVASLREGHPHHAYLCALARGPFAEFTRNKPGALPLFWFRTCETFGADAGHVFAQELSALLGTRVAGHTHIIGVLQSGLQGLMPGEAPHWSAEAGLLDGTAANPRQAADSSPSAPRTIHFMNGVFPSSWFRSEP